MSSRISSRNSFEYFLQAFHMDLEFLLKFLRSSSKNFSWVHPGFFFRISAGNSSRVPSRILRRLLREFLSSFTRNFFGFPWWIFQEFFQSSFRNSLDFLQIPRSSTRISFGDPLGFSLEFSWNFLHGSFRNFSNNYSTVSPGILSECLQEFLWELSKNFFRAPHWFFSEFLRKFLRKFLQISPGNSFGAPLGIPSDFLVIFFEFFQECFRVPLLIPWKS